MEGTVAWRPGAGDGVLLAFYTVDEKAVRRNLVLLCTLPPPAVARLVRCSGVCRTRNEGEGTRPVDICPSPRSAGSHQSGHPG